MNILALEPYHGGSHAAFLEGWQAHSRHTFTVLALPANKWKWRMRHAPITFADRLRPLVEAGPRWDAVWASDMLNLAEFLGLAPLEVRALPAVLYFHENQLTYPVQNPDERDLHFGFTHVPAALAARQVWFNSAFHREEFLAAVKAMVSRMPNHRPKDAADRIAQRSSVFPPGVEAFPKRGPREDGPVRILWAARWEFDKDFPFMADALRILEKRGVDFRLSVIGEQFTDCPAAFEEIHAELAHRIDRWGYQESREEYEHALREADLVVSTARHEFFGISVAEAVAAGCLPIVPDRLAYPEVLRRDEGNADFFYPNDATPADLAHRIADCAARLATGDLWQGNPRRGQSVVASCLWTNAAQEMDNAIDATTDPQSSAP